MTRLSAVVLTLTGLLTASIASAQQPTRVPPAAPAVAPTAAPSRQSRQVPPPPGVTAPTPKPAAAPSRAMPLDPAQQVNVRVELTITESPAAAAKKTVTLMTAGGRRGSVRSTLQMPGSGVTMRLSLDASPSVMKDGRIALDLIFDYTPEQSQPPSNTIANLNEQMTIFVTDGKPLLISQSADPKGDRKVTVEVTATVVK